jgi:hypothetical protein
MTAPTDTTASAQTETEQAYCTRCMQMRPVELINGSRRLAFHNVRQDGKKCNGSYALADDRLMASAKTTG